MNGWQIGIATLLKMGAATLIVAALAVATRAVQPFENPLATKPLAAANPQEWRPRAKLTSFSAAAGSRRDLAIHPKIRVRANQPEDWRRASQQVP